MNGFNIISACIGLIIIVGAFLSYLFIGWLFVGHGRAHDVALIILPIVLLIAIFIAAGFGVFNG